MTGKHEHLHALSGDAGIRNAAEIAAGLRDALQKGQAVSVDTSALTAADLTTIQTLLAARIEARKQGRAVTLSSPLGAPLRQALRDMGLLAPGQPHRDFWPLSSDQP